MTQRCTVGGELHGPEVPLCPEHLCELVPHQPGPGETAHTPGPGDTAHQPGDTAHQPGDTAHEPGGAGAGPGAPVTACWNCGTPPASPTSTECLAPDCRRPLTPPGMLVVFAYGQVEIAPGGQVELGRDGTDRRLFRSYPNVSRRHAVLGVDPDGRAWITPVPTPNGTFVNGDEIPAVQRFLASGDRIRLALDAEGTVTLFPRQRNRTPE
ncbi:FHA domain-containing protein [Micromonospora sp. WMMD714]|uniref:FHA domain-containing protein n=1 Tax=Micromonospora sp. WMMD714 TaxID=3016097 RepID=UPI00249C8A17|nr:FHA domain-containing protein [Micromonospora sp. WMMD714]WFE62981.1 FHA domain-containing protein [Micromonospora sp. WMMD714]